MSGALLLSPPICLNAMHRGIPLFS